MKKRKIISAFLCGLMLATTACASSSTGGSRNAGGSDTKETSSEDSTSAAAKSDGTYTVGILAQKDLASMSETVEGVRSRLRTKYGDNVRFDYVCADGKDDRYDEALTRFVGNSDDVIVAVGSEALTHAAAATTSIPIVGACVTDYLSTGLINSEDQPGGNITGVTDCPPVQQQAQMIVNYFVSGGQVSDDYVGGYAGDSEVTAAVADSDSDEDNRVGIIYTADDAGSEFTARVLGKYLTADSVDWKSYAVEKESDIEQQVKDACEECSVLYLPADVMLAENMSVIRSVTLDEEIPVITAESSMCAEGGLATYSIDYTQEGETAADMVSDILERNSEDSESSSGSASTEESEEESKKGNPEKMEIQDVSDSAAYYYNPVTAQELGWSGYGVFSALDDTHAQSGSTASTSDAARPGTGTRTYSDTSE